MDTVLNFKIYNDHFLFLLYNSKVFKENKREILKDYNLLETKNRDGKTLLNLASLDSEIELVSYLLEKGSDPNTKDSKGNTPLHNSINHYHKNKNKTINIMEILINYGCDIETINKCGYTVLQLACFYDLTDLILLLLEKYKANPNGCFVDSNIPELSELGEIPALPLYYALFHRNKEVITKLLDSGSICYLSFEQIKEKPFRPICSGPIFKDIHAIYCLIFCCIDTKNFLSEWEDNKNLELFEILLNQYNLDPNVIPTPYYPNCSCLKILIRNKKWKYANILLKKENTIIEDGLYYEAVRKNCPNETFKLLLSKNIRVDELARTLVYVISAKQHPENLKNNKGKKRLTEENVINSAIINKRIKENNN